MSRVTRKITVAATCLTLLAAVGAGVGFGAPAYAGSTFDPSPGSGRQVGSGGKTLTSAVTLSQSDDGRDARPLVSADTNWLTPPCWYEPFFTPAQFKSYLLGKYDVAGHDGAMTVYNYYDEVMSEMNAIHYHEGDKGKWWMVVDNRFALATQQGYCDLSPSWKWIGPATPAPATALTPTMLSKVAYSATHLPSHAVTLSPPPGRQKVNFPVNAAFDAPVNRVWVTAQLASAGIAATVVAVPESLHLDAGTPYAAPRTCDYPFTRSGNAYRVDTSHAACNITYRKSSAAGSYPMAARITWKVTWNATAGPDGPALGALPDGYSTSQQNVTVREIQVVVR